MGFNQRPQREVGARWALHRYSWRVGPGLWHAPGPVGSVSGLIWSSPNPGEGTAAHDAAPSVTNKGIHTKLHSALQQMLAPPHHPTSRPQAYLAIDRHRGERLGALCLIRPPPSCRAHLLLLPVACTHIPLSIDGGYDTQDSRESSFDTHSILSTPPHISVSIWTLPSSSI
jgi:hypothetical protein